MWRHIDFTFTHTPLNPKEQVMFEQQIAKIIIELGSKVKRKFYLYEPNPHCFLAIETDTTEKLVIVEENIKKQCDFIAKAKLNPNDTKDEDNGEDFCIILDAFTDAYLFHRKTKLTHIVHCCMEFIHQTRDKEINFYNKMLALYGGEEYR